MVLFSPTAWFLLPGFLGCSNLQDADQDGYSAADDCDDEDPDRHPDASETCDGQDDDCDGAVDEAAVDASSWYTDADGDGWGSDLVEPTLSCDQPDDSVDRAGDCDDSDDAIYPDAHDTPLDGIDQDCDDLDNDGEYTGDLALTTEDELTDFCTDYRSVTGSLTITDSSLADLSALDCLLWVGENLEITATALTSASLPALLSVGEDLVVSQAASLETLAMDALDSVEGSLVIEGNPQLTTASFVDVCDAGTALVIRDNLSLVDLVFGNLLWVGSEQKTAFAGGHLEGDGLEVSGNALLDALSLPLLATIEGDLLVLGNASLETLDLPVLEEVTGETTIEENERLSRLNLDSIEIWEGDLDFGQAFPTLEVASFGSMTTLQEGRLYIDQASSLQELHANSLILVEGEVRIENTDTLTTVKTGLVEQILGNLTVIDCPELRDLDLHSLEEVTGNLSYENLPSLPDVTLPELGKVRGNLSIEGDVTSEIASTHELTLSSLVSVEGYFLVDTTHLTELSLDALTTVDDGFKIFHNDDLEILSAPRLETVGRYISIYDNGALTTLKTNSLAEVGQGPIYLRENPGLSAMEGFLAPAAADMTFSECSLRSAGVWTSPVGDFQLVLCENGIDETGLLEFLDSCQAIEADKTFITPIAGQCPEL